MEPRPVNNPPKPGTPASPSGNGAHSPEAPLLEEHGPSTDTSGDLGPRRYPASNGIPQAGPSPPSSGVQPIQPATSWPSGQLSPQQPGTGGTPATSAGPSGGAIVQVSKGLKLLGDSWLTPLAAVLGALVSLSTILGQLPGIGTFFSAAYNAVAPPLYIWRGAIIPVLLVAALAALVWAANGQWARLRHKASAKNGDLSTNPSYLGASAFSGQALGAPGRKGEPPQPPGRYPVLWRFALAAMLFLLVAATGTITPSERVVGVLTYQPVAGSQVGEAAREDSLGRQLADYLRGRLNQTGDLVKAVGVARLPGESLSDAGRRIGAQLLVDGAYVLGKGSLETRASLVDVSTGETLGKPEVRDILPDDAQSSQEEVAEALASRIDVASAVTQRASAAAPSCSTAYECYVVGRRYYLWFNQDGYSRSIQLYDQALSIDPQYARAYSGLAEAHILMAGLLYAEGKSREGGDLVAQAGNEAEQAVQYGPSLVESHRARAWVYSNTGLKEAARREFDQIARIKPPDPESTLPSTLKLPDVNPSGDAESLWLLGSATTDADAKVALFDEAIRLKPDMAQVKHDLAGVLYGQGRLDDAEAALLQALRINPNMIYAHDSLGLLYLVRALQSTGGAEGAASGGSPVFTDTVTPDKSMSADNYLVEARRHVDVALSQLPDMASALYLKGVILAAQGSLQPAIHSSRQALAANPDAGAWFIYSGYDDPAMYRVTIEAMRRSISALPEFVYNYNSLGSLYMAQGHTYEAMQVYSQAVALDPSFGVGWYNLAVSQAWLGEYDAAVVSARQAVSRTTTWSRAYSELGVTLVWLGENKRPDAVAYGDSSGSLPAATPVSMEGLPTPLPSVPVPEGCDVTPQQAQVDVSALYSEAELMLRKALELDPHDAMSRTGLGQVLYDQGRLEETRGLAEVAKVKYDEALTELEKAGPEVNEFSAETHYLLGLVYRQEGRLDDAQRELERAFTIDPSGSLTYRAYLSLLQERGNPDAAGLGQRRLNLYRAIVSQHPRSPQHHASLANLYAQAGGDVEALKEYTTALSIDAASPDLHNTLGLYYGNRDRYEPALKEYEEAHRLAPGVSTYLHNMGFAAKALGDMEAARGHPDQAATYYNYALANYIAANDLAPSAEYAIHMGDVYLAQKKYGQAEQEYLKAGEGQADAYAGLGSAFADLQQYDRAVEAYKRAICLDPSQTYYYAALAYTYANSEQYDQAEGTLKAALAIAPADASLHNSLGLLYSDYMENQDSAIEQFQWATRLAPNEAVYHYNLGYSYFLAQKYDLAVPELRAADDLASPQNPSRWQYAVYLGRAYLELDKPGEAKDALERSTQMAPNDPQAFGWLAIAYYKLGDDRSCATMEKAAQLAEQSTEDDVKQGAQGYRDILAQWHCP